MAEEDISSILLWSKKNVFLQKAEKNPYIFNQFRAAMLISLYTGTKTGSCMVIQITFSSTALNYIYPSLSLSLSVHMSPSIQLMSILPYRVISPHKSLQMHEASVCVISNTVPIWNLHPSLSPSGLWQACIHTLTEMFLLQVIISKSVCRANRKCVCLFLFMCLCVTLSLNCLVFPYRHVKKYLQTLLQVPCHKGREVKKQAGER